jgi:hypothetical protein
MTNTRTTAEQVRALADAMWQLLDDFGPGADCRPCLAAIAQARVAYEPFVAEPGDVDSIFPLPRAQEIVRDVING